jgi:hypothetical protein
MIVGKNAKYAKRNPRKKEDAKNAIMIPSY